MSFDLHGARADNAVVPGVGIRNPGAGFIGAEHAGNRLGASAFEPVEYGKLVLCARRAGNRQQVSLFGGVLVVELRFAHSGLLQTAERRFIRADFSGLPGFLQNSLQQRLAQSGRNPVVHVSRNRIPAHAHCGRIKERIDAVHRHAERQHAGAVEEQLLRHGAVKVRRHRHFLRNVHVIFPAGATLQHRVLYICPLEHVFNVLLQRAQENRWPFLLKEAIRAAAVRAGASPGMRNAALRRSCPAIGIRLLAGRNFLRFPG